MDALRAIAAILVVWNHSWNLLIDHDHQTFNGIWKIINLSASFGHDSVILFFILSGFFIAKSVQSAEQNNRFTWKSYSINRISRLWIVLIPVLFLSFAYDYIGMQTGADLYEKTRNLVNESSIERFTLTNFFASLFFLQPFLADPFGSNGPLWSLSYEFWYYVWFPIIYLCLKTYRKPMIIIQLISFVLITMYLFAPAARSFPIWLIGVLLYNLHENYSKFEAFISKFRIPILILSVLVMLFSFVISRTIFDTNIYVKDYFVAISCTCLLVFLKISNIKFSNILEPLKTYGAGSSFSLYLTHIPFIFLVLAYIAPNSGLLISIPSLLIAIAITLIAIIQGYIFSRFTEYKTESFRKYLKTKLS